MCFDGTVDSVRDVVLLREIRLVGDVREVE